MQFETRPEELRQALDLMEAIDPILLAGVQARAVRDALKAHEVLAFRGKDEDRRDRAQRLVRSRLDWGKRNPSEVQEDVIIYLLGEVDWLVSRLAALEAEPQAPGSVDLAPGRLSNT